MGILKIIAYKKGPETLPKLNQTVSAISPTALATVVLESGAGQCRHSDSSELCEHLLFNLFREHIFSCL